MVMFLLKLRKKIFLFVILLSSIFVGNGYADHCGHEVDQSWKYTSNNTYASWTFKSRSNRDITITHIGLKTKSEDYMADYGKNIHNNICKTKVSYVIYIHD